MALIAQSFLRPEVRRQVQAMLEADADPLTAHDIASAATWADRLRDRDVGGARQRTRQWHFVDIELEAPNLEAACFDLPPLPPGTPASAGPAADCVVNKIGQFWAELADPALDPAERLAALKFLLHLVGDVHQPLHAADSHDRGGNAKRVSAPGLPAGNLHHYWDTEFVRLLGPDADGVAARLAAGITAQQAEAWARGGAADWALDTFAVARTGAYGRLPTPTASGTYVLDGSYAGMAAEDVAMQLSKAGVRLALVLNAALGAR